MNTEQLETAKNNRRAAKGKNGKKQNKQNRKKTASFVFQFGRVLSISVFPVPGNCKCRHFGLKGVQIRYKL